MRAPALIYLNGFTEDSYKCVCIFSSVLGLAHYKQGLILSSYQHGGVNSWALPFSQYYIYSQGERLSRKQFLIFFK